MRLVVDASILVAEALRKRGRALLANPNLDLLAAAEALAETEHELRKRTAMIAAHGRLDLDMANLLLEAALALIHSRVGLVEPAVYASHLGEAPKRIPRDERDAPAVALAMALGCGIWTADRDFFGCGVPTWTTESLLRHLALPGDEL
ncbi:MAG: hypothetical protein HW416_2778 [Chloroflexi bacterium]|nr:hypothetical protein [Chloroflexota bacterium]